MRPPGAVPASASAPASYSAAFSSANASTSLSSRSLRGESAAPWAHAATPTASGAAVVAAPAPGAAAVRATTHRGPLATESASMIAVSEAETTAASGALLLPLPAATTSRPAYGPFLSDEFIEARTARATPDSFDRSEIVSEIVSLTVAEIEAVRGEQHEQLTSNVKALETGSCGAVSAEQRAMRLRELNEAIHRFDAETSRLSEVSTAEFERHVQEVVPFVLLAQTNGAAANASLLAKKAGLDRVRPH